MSSKSVRQYCKLVNKPCKIDGSGFAIAYSIDKDESGNIIMINITLAQTYKE